MDLFSTGESLQGRENGVFVKCRVFSPARNDGLYGTSPMIAWDLPGFLVEIHPIFMVYPQTIQVTKLSASSCRDFVGAPLGSSGIRESFFQNGHGKYPLTEGISTWKVLCCYLFHSQQTNRKKS